MKDISIMTKGMGKVFLRFHVGKEDCSSTPGISLSYFQMCSWVSSRGFVTQSVCYSIQSIKFGMKLAWIFLFKAKY